MGDTLACMQPNPTRENSVDRNSWDYAIPCGWETDMPDLSIWVLLDALDSNLYTAEARRQAGEPGWGIPG
jgi:hypothetical protein